MNRIEFVLVLIFTFFVIVVWVTSDVILVKPNTPDDPKIQTLIEPLNPNFDQETMQLINGRTLNTPIRPTPRPVTPSPQPAASATSENDEEPTPSPRPTNSNNEASNNLTVPAEEQQQAEENIEVSTEQTPTVP